MSKKSQYISPRRRKIREQRATEDASRRLVQEFQLPPIEAARLVQWVGVSEEREGLLRTLARGPAAQAGRQQMTA